MTEPNIELLNMDCLLYMKQCEDKQFDWAIVDPPYGINYDKQQNKQAENERISNGGKWKKYHDTNWDSSVPDIEYWNELFRVSKNQIVWGGNYFFDVNLNGVIIWNKGENGTMKQGELAKCSKNTFKIYNKSRIDAYVNSGELKIHPCQKPTSLYEWIIDNYVSENEKIIDTHLGSGSIALACWNRKFDLVGIEIDSEYFQKASKRLEQHKKQLTLF